MELNNDTRCCWTDSKVKNLAAVRDGLYEASLQLALLSGKLNEENPEIVKAHCTNNYCAQYVANYLTDEIPKILKQLETTAKPFIDECRAQSMSNIDQVAKAVGNDNPGVMLAILARLLGAQLDDSEEEDVAEEKS